MTERRRALLVAAGAALLYALCRHAYYVGFFNDDAFYVIGARALAHGRYAELSAPGEPPLVNYLPGYPLLLAPVAAVAGGALWPFQAFSILLTAGALFFVWLYFDEAPPPARLAGLAAAAFCPLCVSMGAAVLSDVTLLAVFALAFCAARRVWQRRGLKEWLALAALGGLAALIRPTGFVLPAALVASLCLERRFKNAALCGALGFSPPALFVLRNRLVAGETITYFREAAGGGMGRAVVSNLAFYPKFAFVTSLFRFPGMGRYGDAVVIGVGILCVVLAVREEESWEWRKLVQLTLGLFLLAHLLWSKQAGRYLLPLVPFLAGYLFWGAALLAKEYGGGAGACWWLAALSLALSLKPDLAIARASIHRDTEAARPAEETFAWLRDHTRKDDVLASELDGRVYLYTGRKTTHLRRHASAENLARWLSSVKARWVVILPNASVMRTATGGTPFDPSDVAVLERWLSDRRRYRLAFRAPREEAAVYEVAEPSR